MTSNRLAGAASAYLKSAAHQPVHWYPWGDEPFAAARQGDKPVLLDIGAVWCHWCHVMDGESYENAELANYLNEHFVCVKVDRDERPDVDARYQRAVQALTSQGGWPLTAFLTPAGEVFYGGTYFPPDGKYGRPGFRTVLAAVIEAYRERRAQVGAQAQAIRRVVDQELDDSARGPISPELLESATRRITAVFDRRNGGFGAQPKFPHPLGLRFLLHRWWDGPTDELRTIVDRTLQGMGRGGVYDQLGGGFHRYSVDAQWIVPHFEKMSYDNSELLVAYLDAYALFGTEEYADVARGIVHWVREVMAPDAEGGYAASQDADVGLDDDGDYFTWTRDEAAAVLTPDELDLAAAYYDIGTAGEMQHHPGKNVLFVATSVAEIAKLRGMSEDEVSRRLETARAKLVGARAERQAPFVDHTRYTAWNAMMVSAMLRAGAVLENDWATGHALATLARMRREATEPDAVAHTPGGVQGLLDDQVQTAAAALDGYEVSGEHAWLDWAAAIMERVWRDYRDESGGGLFDTARGRDGELGLLPARAKPVQDTPTPSPNGVAGIVLARLHELTGDARWGERQAELIEAFAGRAAEMGLHAATYLLAVDWHLGERTHLAIVGGTDDPVANAMHRAALAAFVPRRVVLRLPPDAAREAVLPPALAGMVAAAGAGARGYACTGTACGPPSETLEDWRAALGALGGARVLD